VSGPQIDRKCVGEHCEIKDQAQGEITAVVATLNTVDRDADVCLTGSFPLISTVKMSGYGHGVVLDGAAPVGLGTISVEGNKAILRAQYFMSTNAGREAFYTVEGLGDQGEFSFGYLKDVKTAAMTDSWRAKGARRLIAGLTPIEASAVFRAAGVGTGLLSTKCSDCGGNGHGAACSCEDGQFAAMMARSKQLLRDAAISLNKSAPRPLSPEELERRVDVNMARCISAVERPSDWTRATARRWADAADAILGMPRATIKWEIFSRKELGSFDRSEPDVIRLSPRIPAHRIGEAVLHEQTHRFRHLNRLPDTEQLVEQDTLFLLSRLA
jgi:hypothetical protein